MHRRMHNNDFDILLRSDHLSPKLQIPKIHKILKKKNKCYLYNTSWVFEFSYKLFFTKKFGYLSPGFILAMQVMCKQHVATEGLFMKRKAINNKISHQYYLTMLNVTLK